MDCPGASSDSNGETFENDAMTSDFVVAPTLMAVEMQAGEFKLFVSPSLPAATTVAMPADRRLSMIAFVGSLSHAADDPPPPRLKFAATMLRVPRTASTRSSPAMI